MYKISLVNNETEEQGLTIAIFRVPSCLQIDVDQLDSLYKDMLFDGYEIRSA